jgi:hypothetical protein
MLDEFSGLDASIAIKTIDNASEFRSDAVEAIAGNKILPKPAAGCNPR